MSIALQSHSPNSIKMIASYQLVRSLPEDDLIMMVDGFDVVFQASAHHQGRLA